jgi:hypothetical protein
MVGGFDAEQLVEIINPTSASESKTIRVMGFIFLRS